ncbi:hypothetical protein GCM10009589_06580 [Arthrobacter pascens]
MACGGEAFSMFEGLHEADRCCIQWVKKRVCTMCTPGASDSVVLAADRFGLGMFSGRGGFSGGGARFESYLGHSMTPRQRGFCFNVWTLISAGPSDAVRVGL